MSPGAALFDYDNDGDLDVYLLQGAVLNPKKTPADSLFPAPNKPGARLFRNDLIPSGRLTFRDVTEESGVGNRGYGMGVAAGDYDNDGDLDLFVTNFGADVLYRNDGAGKFADVTERAGLAGGGFTTSAAWVDYDRDGDLDLYVPYYNAFSIEGNKRCLAPSGARDYCGPTSYFPLPDKLYRNDGEGRFTDVSRETGVASAEAAGLGVAATDFNLDGRVDLFVANDMTPNFLWINQGDGTLEENGLLSGIAYNEDGEVEASMGVAVGDYDGDGDPDVFLTHLRDQTNTLYRNDGTALFDDVTVRFGLDIPSLAATGFGSSWIDYDNDGRLDLFSANGSIMQSGKHVDDPFPYGERNQLFRNEGGSFVDVSAESGKEFEREETSRAAAFGDIDNDGDLDILLTNCNGPARLLLNQVGQKRRSLRVTLRGVSSDRFALGARVAAERPSEKPVWRHVSVDGSYLSSSDNRILFGLGERQAPQSLLVVWPNGAHERFALDGDAHEVELTQGKGTKP
ncbi:MAG: CRTAC1 family protein [Bryobacterales bacterium]